MLQRMCSTILGILLLSSPSNVKQREKKFVFEKHTCLLYEVLRHREHGARAYLLKATNISEQLGWHSQHDLRTSYDHYHVRIVLSQ